MGIFRSFNVAFAWKASSPFFLSQAGAHQAVTIWNLRLRRLTCFKENIIIWKPCKEKCVCTKKRHYLPFVETPIIYIFTFASRLVLNNSDIFFKCKLYFWKFLKCEVLFFPKKKMWGESVLSFMWQLWPSPGSLIPTQSDLKKKEEGTNSIFFFSAWPCNFYQKFAPRILGGWGAWLLE